MTARRRRGMLSGLALAGAGIVAALGPVSAPALPGVPPTASITASPNPAMVNENVNIDGSGSTGDGLGSSITTYEWDLDGDNTFETNTGNNPNVSRSYSAPATITVTLRVTDDDGDTDEDSVSLVVNSPPTAGFIYEPSTPAVNEQITFSSTSSDAEGPIPDSSQRWDFDNDGQFDDAIGHTVTHAFSSPGTKSVALRVTDSDGASATVVRNVVVQSNPPSAAFSFAPQSPLSSETVVFDGSGSIAPSGQTITAMTWDLDDDGAFDDGSGLRAQSSYSTPGPHTVRLRVDASGGGFDISSQVVPVGNRPPTASFEFSPRPARAGKKLRLTSTSSDPDGPIVGTAWDLDGDGEFDDASGPTAHLHAPMHGRLTVGLEVMDSGGVSDLVRDSVPLRAGPRKLLAPFPVVRLAGELKQNGNTEIDRLSVRAPKASDVTVDCHGRSCPFRSRTRAVKKHRVGFPGLERVLRPGLVISVYVTDPHKIGKFTSFKLRDGKAPRRTDSCLKGEHHKPIPCPH
jgi:PKD repeat protein